MRLPDSSHRIAIVGATGSGKTQAALWHLSLQDIETRPWVVLNFKGEKSIDQIPHARMIELDEIPIKPGVYIYHPAPSETDKEKVENIMWEIWARENTGVYVDEGYMVPRFSESFTALLTQGRSKNIPMINLSQRPSWLNPFLLSESDFLQVFRLQWSRDRKKMEEFIPTSLDRELPRYHSYYYDVHEHKLTALKPVPDIVRIHATFDRRLARVRRTV